MKVDGHGEISLPGVDRVTRVRMARHADYYADTFDDVVALAQVMLCVCVCVCVYVCM